MRNLGRSHKAGARGATATDCYEQAAIIHRELDDRRAQAQPLDN